MDRIRKHIGDCLRPFAKNEKYHLWCVLAIFFIRWLSKLKHLESLQNTADYVHNKKKWSQSDPLVL